MLSPCCWGPCSPWWASAPAWAGTRGGGTGSCDEGGGAPLLSRLSCPVAVHRLKAPACVLLTVQVDGLHEVTEKKNAPGAVTGPTGNTWCEWDEEESPGSPKTGTATCCSAERRTCCLVSKETPAVTVYVFLFTSAQASWTHVALKRSSVYCLNNKLLWHAPSIPLIKCVNIVVFSNRPDTSMFFSSVTVTEMHYVTPLEKQITLRF